MSVPSLAWFVRQVSLIASVYLLYRNMYGASEEKPREALFSLLKGCTSLVAYGCFRRALGIFMSWNDFEFETNQKTVHKHKGKVQSMKKVTEYGYVQQDYKMTIFCRIALFVAGVVLLMPQFRRELKWHYFAVTFAYYFIYQDAVRHSAVRNLQTGDPLGNTVANLYAGIDVVATAFLCGRLHFVLHNFKIFDFAGLFIKAVTVVIGWCFNSQETVDMYN